MTKTIKKVNKSELAVYDGKTLHAAAQITRHTLEQLVVQARADEGPLRLAADTDKAYSVPGDCLCAFAGNGQGAAFRLKTTEGHDEWHATHASAVSAVYGIYGVQEPVNLEKVVKAAGQSEAA